MVSIIAGWGGGGSYLQKNVWRKYPGICLGLLIPDEIIMIFFIFLLFGIFSLSLHEHMFPL